MPGLPIRSYVVPGKYDIQLHSSNSLLLGRSLANLQRAAQLRRVCEDRNRCSDGTVRARDLPYVQDRHGHLPAGIAARRGSALHV